jgi:predicted  nucleic acid-binding Zn-ribbon protein
MTGTVQASVTAGEIAFDLERFQLDGDQLKLNGRWFGVRGRRFVRPTLTPLAGKDRSRVLADLEHKPWPAEDGGEWEAAFPWNADRSLTKFELSVSPDIAIELPSPSARRERPRRLTALPRRRLATAGWRSGGEDELDHPSSSTSSAPSALQLAHAELEGAKRELETAHDELAATRNELAARDDELDAARVELAATASDRDAAGRETADIVALRDELLAEREQLYGERHELGGERDRLTAERDRRAAERDALAAERDELVAAQDALAVEHQQLKAERDRLRLTLAQLEASLAQATSSLEQAARQRDDAVAQRGAALVMRGAARATPNYEAQAGWWKPTLALLGLLAVVVAVLIVTHVI